MNNIKLVQISDSHLFAEPERLHCGANVYQNLKQVLHYISCIDHVDAIIFTGDLTQDHSAASYQRFNELVEAAELTCPLYYLAGNHDDEQTMNTELNSKVISSNKEIQFNNWQVQLIDSKSETPAGHINDVSLTKAVKISAENKYNVLFMHHHPVDVGYFIDKHGLTNQQQFWQSINQINNMQAIFCGHVHRGCTINKGALNNIAVHTCPATSIQFDPSQNTVSALDVGPGMRIITLHADGKITSFLKYLEF